MRETCSRTVQTDVYKCDFCGKVLSRRHRCPGCLRDICENCGHWWMSNPWTGDDNGDYPDLACGPCHELAMTMSQETLAIQQEADDQIEGILVRWRTMCMNSGVRDES